MEIPKYTALGRFHLDDVFIYEEEGFSDRRVAIFINNVKFAFDNTEEKLDIQEVYEKLFSGKEFVCQVFLASSSRDRGEFLDYTIKYLGDGYVELKKVT